MDGVAVGTCFSMCPEREKMMRREANRIHFLERPQGGETRDIMVKEFIRTTPGMNVSPRDLRPAKVLLETMNHLVQRVLPRNDRPFHEVYNFLFDRFRAIRQDLTIQSIGGSAAVAIYEVISRFLIYSGYRLRNEPADFCSTTNLKHLLECLSRLFLLYESQGSANFEEFLSYRLLVCFGSHDALADALSRTNLRQMGMVATAISMNMAWICKNYVRVLKMARHLSALNACIFHDKLNDVRISVVRVMSAAYSAKNVAVPIDDLSRILLVEGKDKSRSTTELLASCGATVVDGERVSFSIKDFVPPTADKGRFSSSWIDSLVNCEPRESLVAGPAVDLTNMMSELKVV